MWGHMAELSACGEEGDDFTLSALQTDEEKRRGLPVMMPSFDRATCDIAKSQTGFISYFVRDMFRAWSEFGDFPELVEYIEKNFIYWKDKETSSTALQETR